MINKITIEHICSKIKAIEYINPTGTLTIAIITLKNGFIVTGESSCINPNNYSKAIGENIAHDNAVNKIWQLEGYLSMEDNQRSESCEDSPTQPN